MTSHARLTVLLSLALAAVAVPAQQVYRHVDKSGKVSFSDQPPAPDAQSAASRSAVSPAEGAGVGLPYELQQVVQRYPVTIYTRDECGPCDAGRSLLTTRGVPFSERQVQTPEDSQALQSLSGQNSLPLLSIGAQQLKGFSDAEWSQYLDAAGYPKSIRLPAGYRNPAAQPLVAQRPAAAAAPAAAAPAPAAPAATAPDPGNPAGIKF
jgi:glutaredoxin